MAKRHISAIASRFAGVAVADGWVGLDAVLPILERIKREGCIVLIKFDGQRTSEEDNGPYTAMISGNALHDGPLRNDAAAVEDAIANVILEYAQQCWDYRG